MKQVLDTIWVPTRGPGLYQFTQDAIRCIRKAAIAEGLLTCFIRHTSASLIIQENADPDVAKDLQDFFAAIATYGPGFRHTAEGPDDMPSHIRSALTQTTLAIPLHNGEPVLGTWQGLFVFEHRNEPHRREIKLHMIGQ